MRHVDAMFVRAWNAWLAVRDGESGATMVEYGLMVSLIAVACMTALGVLSGHIQTLFSDVGIGMENGPAGPTGP